MEDNVVASSSDAERWEALKMGNTIVYEEIFKQHYSFLFNYCQRFQDDEDEIKDCLQILFLTIWERRTFLGPTTSIKNYLLSSLRRLVLKRMKSDSLRLTIDPDTFNLHSELSIEAQMIRDQTASDRLSQLQRGVEKLPARQKEALYLKYYGEQSFADIAHTMNISTRAVYKLIYKALDALTEEFTAEPVSVLMSVVPFLLSTLFLLR
ncbi:RNA polymerase sigma factor [Rhabdobacter roseus]|nr:sigma-70 family RNA polymerase sigma factor [Rhabdobacter roseus]